MSRALVVTGGASGVGREFCQAWLASHGDSTVVVIDTAKTLSEDLALDSRVYHWRLDVRDLASLTLQAHKASFEPDTIVQCAGINGICPLDELKDDLWDQVMDTNARGLWHVVQAFLPALKRQVEHGVQPLVMNVVSNASHMPMTDSCAYNASKGAAHIMTLQMARELTRKYGISVIGVSPNKLAGTRMSNYIDQQVMASRGWSLEEARSYQLQSLLWREETPCTALAQFMVDTLSRPRVARWLSGCVIPFGA